MEQNLSNFIKYCLSYVKLTRERTAAAQQKYSVNLPSEHFSLLGLLNGDTDGSISELINLETFYSYDPKQVPKEKKEQYEKEKDLANKIEEIYNKYRNDHYTKQVVFNFGYFEIEIPIDPNSGSIEVDNTGEIEESSLVKTKINRHPLFSLPIRIEKEISKGGVGKYYIYSVDSEVQVNIATLEPVLGQDLYYQLLEEIGKYEIEGRLSLPIIDFETFKEIWHKIKAQLRLKEANFGEDSFLIEEIKVSLGPKANYFLAEDLAKLAQLPEKELVKTALTSWTDDEGLNIESEIPNEKQLYFPFLYDKYQLSTLSILGNKAAIIQGPPGTGKSETISNILCHLAANRKKVLFVGQKAQALKVVKDKLKKLGVKYLYGYLPNPQSAQIGEEDEADGIAPQLSALGAHIEKLGYRFNTRKNLVEYRGVNSESYSIEQTVMKKEKYRNKLNTIIDSQRNYYQLHQELISLKDYDIDITDFGCFEKSFSSAEWKEIKETRSYVESLRKVIKKYEQNDDKKKFDELFISIDLNGKKLSEEIGKLREDVSKTGYDRHSNLLRKLNNLNRNFRLLEVRDKLPREIIDYIDGVLTSDISRSEATNRLNSLFNYCYYYENIQSLEAAKEKLRKKLSTCGVSDEEFDQIDNKIEAVQVDELDKVKSKILRVQEIKSELKKTQKQKI